MASELQLHSAGLRNSAVHISSLKQINASAFLHTETDHIRNGIRGNTISAGTCPNIIILRHQPYFSSSAPPNA